MENDTLQIEITTPGQTNEVETSLQKKLESLPSLSTNNCCIYRVPRYLRNECEEHFRPLAVSIGPIFYKDTHLEAMQDIKLSYLKCFLEDPDNACSRMEDYINHVRQKEQQIRDCYEEQKSISSNEFIEMVVIDAAFLIYLFTKSGFTDFSLGFSFLWNKLQGKLLRLAIVRDILIVENQLPFFILSEIYDIAFRKEDKPESFAHVTLRFMANFQNTSLGYNIIESIIQGKKVPDPSNIIHLLDLCTMSLHLWSEDRQSESELSVSNIDKVMTWPGITQLLCCCRIHPNRNSNSDEFDGNHSNTAKQLNEAGVKFMKIDSDNPLDITFADGKLAIPIIHISEVTESYWRNILYYEQSHPQRSTPFTDYILFLDALIDTVEDVQVLVESKIIDNTLGSDEDTLNLFNKVGRNWVTSGELYDKVSRDVNGYASTSWNRWMATLRTKYFYNPWVIISVIAAFMLFVLTLLQTIASYVFK